MVGNKQTNKWAPLVCMGGASLLFPWDLCGMSMWKEDGLLTDGVGLWSALGCVFD